MKTSRVRGVLARLVVCCAASSLASAPAVSSAARGRGQGPRVYGPAGPGVPRPDSRAGAVQWERYSFPGDEFSVELPGMPFVYHTDRSVTPTDQEKTRVFGHYFDGVVFVVVSYDRPRRSETLEAFAGYPWYGRRIPEGREIKLDGLDGKEYRGGAVVDSVSRVFKTGGRAYLVSALYHAERRAAAERFLDSFRLKDAPRGREISEAGDAAAAPAVGAPAGGANSTPDHKERPAPAPQLAEDDPSHVFRQKAVTHKAMIVYKGDPGWTKEALRNNVTGVVRLRAVLRPNGRVTDVSVVKGLPDGLTGRAVDAARHILFFPAVKDGRAVAQHVTLEYNFQIYE